MPDSSSLITLGKPPALLAGLFYSKLLPSRQKIFVFGGGQIIRSHWWGIAVDAGYTSVSLMVSAQQEYEVELFGSVPNNHHWQAKAEQGFDTNNFNIDWFKKVVYCPQGKTSQRWKPSHDTNGNSTIYIAFAQKDFRYVLSETNALVP